MENTGENNKTMVSRCTFLKSLQSLQHRSIYLHGSLCFFFVDECPPSSEVNYRLFRPLHPRGCSDRSLTTQSPAPEAQEVAWLSGKGHSAYLSKSKPLGCRKRFLTCSQFVSKSLVQWKQNNKRHRNNRKTNYSSLFLLSPSAFMLKRSSKEHERKIFTFLVLSLQVVKQRTPPKKS